MWRVVSRLGPGGHRLSTTRAPPAGKPAADRSHLHAVPVVAACRRRSTAGPHAAPIRDFVPSRPPGGDGLVDNRSLSPVSPAGSGYCVDMPSTRPTAATLRPGHHPDGELSALAAEADEARGDVRRALDLAQRWGERLPAPGRGRTVRLWEALATLGAVDLTVARVVEPHLDALAILDETRGGTWGVWAAEGPDARLRA